MDPAAYLRRICYAAPLEASRAALFGLHLAHLHTVPFENLDIHLRQPISLALPDIYDKVVARRRGGFCYELNGLFAWLLGELGFTVTHVSASDARADGSYGPEFDHLALCVQYPEDYAKLWLADVGWGDTFTEPLDLRTSGEQGQGLRAYRIDREGERRVLWQRDYDGRWQRHYQFTLQPRRLADFAAMALYHQTSPESEFTRGRICTLATPDGRVSLDKSRLLVTTHGQRREEPVGDEAAFRRILLERFGIVQ
jgi:N-hydroxyarylamine O-acetyltransferase